MSVECFEVSEGKQMLSFGWVTQEKFQTNRKANTRLTNAIKKYLRECGYERFRDENINNRNCLYNKTKKQYIVVYTRDGSGGEQNLSWAIYEYVKKMAENKNNVNVILGVLEEKDDILAGRFYWLTKHEIIAELDGKVMVEEQYYTVSEKKEWGVYADNRFDFENEEELENCLEQCVNE